MVESDLYVKDAKELRKAMEGFSTDEKSLIHTVTTHKTRDSLKIKKSYQEKYNKDLKSELNGKFQDAMIALFKDPVEYYSECLYYAMKGAGTDEACLI